MSIQIYMTSFHRKDFTAKSVQLIKERTNAGTYSLNIYDNGSTEETRQYLYNLLKEGLITSLTLDSRNTGCLYNKIVFNSMVETKDKYFCTTDNDVLPPKVSPDWLSQMIDIMEKHPEIAILAPQLPPQGLQVPYYVSDDVIYCQAVGNTFRLLRKSCIDKIIYKIEQKLGAYGDDGLFSELVEKEGYKVAFCKSLYCLHIGQTENWGYTKDQIAKDPRKAGYGKPFSYNIVNEETYEPEPMWKM